MNFPSITSPTFALTISPSRAKVAIGLCERPNVPMNLYVNAGGVGHEGRAARTCDGDGGIRAIDFLDLR